MTMMALKDKTFLKPKFWTVGSASISSSSRFTIALRKKGRKKATKTVAAACIPGVPENKSTEYPSKNAKTNDHGREKSNGNSRINIIYNNGFRYPLIFI